MISQPGRGVAPVVSAVLPCQRALIVRHSMSSA
jgi:hypothetical protein